TCFACCVLANGTATAALYTLSLHDALPIWLNAQQTMPSADTKWFDAGTRAGLQTNHNLSISSGSEHGNKYLGLSYYKNEGTQIRSEEHTSELQSRENLVCRLLLEKKNSQTP